MQYRKVNNNSDQCVIALHGYGASMDDLFDLSSYLDPNHQYDWYFLNAPLEVNLGFMMSGRAWFDIDVRELDLAARGVIDRSFADKEPDQFFQSLQLIKTFIQAELNHYKLCNLLGFSQGAMVALHLSQHLNNVKKCILFSTALLATSTLEKSIDKSVRYYYSHGKNDPVINYKESQILKDFLSHHNKECEFHSFEGGHEIPLSVLESSKEFLHS